MAKAIRVPALSVTDDDIARTRDQLFFEGPQRRRRISRFWMLLVLSAVIAGAGVVGDSTATVIGAMIVAPLMTPILGVVLAVVLADRANLARSLLMVVAGAATVVAVGWLIGLAVPYAVVADTNSQVASRVDPRLIDLLAALATGAVGSVALARSDISDTLPGVAIAISLVPPLSVVGLTLQSGAPGQAAGALLLFLTNVTAILASGILVMALYRVHAHAPRPGGEVRYFSRRGASAVIVVLVAVVAVPLGFTTRQVTRAEFSKSVRSLKSPNIGAGPFVRPPRSRRRPGSVHCATRPSKQAGIVACRALGADLAWAPLRPGSDRRRCGRIARPCRLAQPAPRCPAPARSCAGA